MTTSQVDFSSTDVSTPGAYIKKINLNAADRDLVVTVDFSLKQLLPGATSAVSQARFRNTLRDKLYVLVIATANQEIARKILTDRSLLNDYLVFNNTGETKTKILSLQDSTINLNNASGLTPSEIGQIYGTDLPFTESFRFVNGLRPNYLSLFAISFLNLNSDSAAVQETFGDVGFGTLASELVIKAGALNMRSLTFYKGSQSQDNSALWLGAIHQDSRGQWRTGATGAPPGVPPMGELLYALPVYNSKVSDNRTIARMEKLQLNFNNAALLSGVSDTVAKRLKSIQQAKENCPTYISDIYYSKSENNSLRFYFAINYLDIVKANGKYATLYKSNADLLTSCDILSFNIIRRRVNKANIFNKLTGGESPFRIYDKKIDRIGTPTRINLTTTGTGIMHYFSADPEMDDITTGLYEYGVEIEILDNTQEKLSNILAALQAQVSLIEIFLSDSLSNKGNYNALLNRYTPEFMTLLKEVYGAKPAADAPWAQAISIYASALAMLFGPSYAVSGISSQSAIDDLFVVATPTSGSPEGLQYLVQLLKSFMSSLSTAIGSSSIKKPNKPAGKMPSNKLSSAKRIFKIRQFFEAPFDADDLVDLGLDFVSLVPNPESNDSGLKYISYNQWNMIASNQANKTNNSVTSGSAFFLTPNYLRMPTSDPINLFSIDPADQQVVEKRMYQILVANMERNSPIVFERGGGRGSLAYSANAASRAQNQTTIMNTNSCIAKATLQTAENPITSMFEDIEDLTPQQADHTVLEDSNALFSADSAFGRSTTGTHLISGSTDPLLLQPGIDASLSDTAANTRANISLIANYLIQTDFLVRSGDTAVQGPGDGNRGLLKNRNDSLLQLRKETTDKAAKGKRPGPRTFRAAFGSTNSFQAGVSREEVSFINNALSGTLDPAAMPQIATKYGFVYTVEYLAAYGISGTALIKNPVWLQLDQSTAAESQGTGKSMLCRLRKHNSFIRDFKGLTTPIYNELFILGPTSRSAPAEESNPRTAPMPRRVEISPDLVNSLMATSDTIEYSNSYDTDVRVAGTPSRQLSKVLRTASALAASEERGTQGVTTIDDKHSHQYRVDARGNGVATEACAPDDPSRCHTHQIVNNIVQSAPSFQPGRTHAHAIRPPTTTTSAPRTPNETQRRPGNSGGGTSSGGTSY
jgi:hypothetical protein